jgi:hypothetical protein
LRSGEKGKGFHGVTVSCAAFEKAFKSAVIVAVTVLVTTEVAIGKVADEAPAGTMT